MANTLMNWIKRSTGSQQTKECKQFLGYSVEVIRRPYQKNVNLSVKPNGSLRISANKTTSWNHIERFLLESKGWIEKSFKEFEKLQSSYPEKKFTQSENFLYLGRKLCLNYYLTTKKKPFFEVQPHELRLFWPKCRWNDQVPLDPKPWLKEDLQKFYKKQGALYLQARIKIYSQWMGLHPKDVSFRGQTSRWGSCSSEGHISLNWKLIAAPLEVLDYVVVHELAHLQHQDHSKNFWELVSRFCPNYKRDRQWLKKNAFEFDFLSKKSELHK